MNEDRLSDYINAHPRECLYVFIISFALIWQTIPALVGILLYFFWIKKHQVLRLYSLVFGLIIFGMSVYFYNGFLSYFKAAFQCNKILFINFLYRHSLAYSADFYLQVVQYILTIPWLMIGILSLIDLIPRSAHENALLSLQKGVLDIQRKELSNKTVDALIQLIPDSDTNDIILGVSKYTGNLACIPDKYVNQVVIVLGTTGAGKTITLRRFYNHAIKKGYPLIIVDGKPDDGDINWLQELANKNNRSFYGFNCGQYHHYDPLTDGGYTELKDKIISLKDTWENDYYRSISEDYLQTTFEVLLREGSPIDLSKVVECLNYDNLRELVRHIKDPELTHRVESLEHYKRDDIVGLQAHLNILVHSELGQFFKKDDSSFRLKQVIDNGGVAYFALPALRFPSFSKVLGKLVINDLKAIIDRNTSKKKIFTVFDEFSVFAGEQVLNLVNMGRGKGVHAVFGTQGLADLDKVDETFKSQILNCTNTMICHRLNDQESAETIAAWIGTADMFNVTAQVNLKDREPGMGSVRQSKEFIVHPDVIKQELHTGEVIFVSKVDGFRQDKIKVKFL